MLPNHRQSKIVIPSTNMCNYLLDTKKGEATGRGNLGALLKLINMQSIIILEKNVPSKQRIFVKKLELHSLTLGAHVQRGLQ